MDTPSELKFDFCGVGGWPEQTSCISHRPIRTHAHVADGDAYSDASRITAFGYQPRQLLPAGTVWILGPGTTSTLFPPYTFPRFPPR